MDALLFDLDNTLYPASAGLFTEIRRRIELYVRQWFGPHRSAEADQRREGTARYGTTLAWLRAEYGFGEDEEYYAAVHPADVAAWLPPQPWLRGLLTALPQPKAILTNAPREHAERVLAYYGVSDLFEAIYDLRWHGGRNKPEPDAYTRALAAQGWSLDSTLFLDDHPGYLAPYAQLGGPVLWVSPEAESADETGRPQRPDFPRIPDLRSLPGWLEAPCV